MGYYLTNSNFNSDDFAQLSSDRIPDIILVRKAYPNRRKKSKARSWKLRSMAKEAGEEGETGAGRGVVGRMGGRDQKKVDEDYELFLRELEEDPELRGSVNLYKANKAAPGTEPDAAIAARLAGGKRKGALQSQSMAMDVEEPISEAGNETDLEEEPDFPEVGMNELLEEFDEMTLEES
jgi:nonsense-mediated mRNA decay protein 3